MQTSALHQERNPKTQRDTAASSDSEISSANRDLQRAGRLRAAFVSVAVTSG